MLKKGSVIFRGVSTNPTRLDRVKDLNQTQYELVEPGSHNVAEDVESIAEPIQQSKTQLESDRKKRVKAQITVEHLDIIKDEFWDRRPWILSNKPGKIPKQP